MITPTHKMITLFLVFAVLRPAATTDVREIGGLALPPSPVAYCVTPNCPSTSENKEPHRHGCPNRKPSDEQLTVTCTDTGYNFNDDEPAPCETCNDTGLESCDKVDCTKVNDDWRHKLKHAATVFSSDPRPLDDCTRPCTSCVLVETSTSRSDFEACPTCKDFLCDGTCKSRRLAERLARAEVRRRLPSDGKILSREFLSIKTGSRARRGSGEVLQLDADLHKVNASIHPPKCTCWSCKKLQQ